MAFPWLSDGCDLPTPCWLIDEAKLTNNLAVLDKVKTQTNCDILLALKAFSSYACFDQISSVIDGVTASSVYESRLGYDHFPGQMHGYMVAASDDDFRMLSRLCTCLSFNSLNQFHRYQQIVPHSTLSLGLRINPMCSVVETSKYDPCSYKSRLGVPLHMLSHHDLDGLDGIHMHALCEQSTHELRHVLESVEHNFGDYIHHFRWFNWGGGHHITRSDYDVDALIQCINDWQDKYDLRVILEPGEAIVLNTGYYVTKVLDIVYNDGPILVCDISATAHMPDVLEYPYRPEIFGAKSADQGSYSYRITGNTCLAGDIIGDYSFDQPKNIGDYLVFSDMAHYTLVKTSNFNGVPCPSIGIIKNNGWIDFVRFSNYYNFKERLS